MTAKPSQHGNDAAKFVVFFNFKFFCKRTFKDLYIKYQNFQGPKPFSRTFQVLEKRKKNSRTFKNVQGRVATLCATSGQITERDHLQLIKFGCPAPSRRVSAAGRKLLALSYYSQRDASASLWAIFLFFFLSFLLLHQPARCVCVSLGEVFCCFFLFSCYTRDRLTHFYSSSSM